MTVASTAIMHHFARMTVLLTVFASMTGCSPRAGAHTQSPFNVVGSRAVLQWPGISAENAGRLSIPWLPMNVRRFAAIIDAASFRHRVDANLIAIVILVESGGNPRAGSPAGARGLMQVMPATGRDIATQRKLSGHHDGRLYDPIYNIDLGSWYLARQLKGFRNWDPNVSVDQAAAAYNGGPGRLRRHLNGGAPLPLETRNYRAWVGGMWRERWLPQSRSYGSWYHAGGGRMVDPPSS